MVQVKGSFVLTVASGDYKVGMLLALTPRTISSTGYTSLGQIMPLLSGLSGNYNRFMVANLRVTPHMLIGYQTGGLVVVNFEADNSVVSGPPTGVTDVTRARHYAMTTPFEAAGICVQPQDYFNDWKDVTDGTSNYPQAGIAQMYGTTLTTGTVAVDIAMVEVECDCYFEGLRYTPT
jgi:hypothetical protein